jgi:hypothetical protein
MPAALWNNNTQLITYLGLMKIAENAMYPVAFLAKRATIEIGMLHMQHYHAYRF